jgi:hypothetical protein
MTKRKKERKKGFFLHIKEKKRKLNKLSWHTHKIKIQNSSRKKKMANKLFEGAKNFWNHMAGPGKFIETG